MRFLSSVLGMLFVGCGGGSDSKPDAEVVVADACVATSPRVAYLHRGGGTYTAGTMDSRTNMTGSVSGSITLPSPTIVEQDWLDFVACVESKFTAFNVSITTTDPGTAPHLEVVIVDRADQVNPSSPGWDALTPVASCRAGKGLVTENGISFVAWETLVDTGRRCQKSAQSIGFLLGLDRAYACNDIMTWDTQFCIPPGEATFVDAEVPCGELEARTCLCGFPTENTFHALQQSALQCPP